MIKALAIALALSMAANVGQVLRTSAIKTALAEEVARNATERQMAADAGRDALERFRQSKAKEDAIVRKALDAERSKSDAAKRDAVRAAAAAVSLRSAFADSLAACGDRASAAPAAAGSSAPASPAGLVQSNVFGRLDDVAGELAAALDASHAAGTACQSIANAGVSQP